MVARLVVYTGMVRDGLPEIFSASGNHLPGTSGFEWLLLLLLPEISFHITDFFILVINYNFG